MRQTTGIIILEGLTGLVLLVGLVLGLIVWRLVSGPTDLEFVRANVEAELSKARGGQPVSVGTLRLLWQHEQSQFEILAEDLTFLDFSDEVVARAQSATIEFDALGLVVGNIELRELHVRDGELSVRRTREGGLTFAGQALPPVYPVQFHEATSPFQYAEQSILNVVENLANSATVANVDEISLSGFQVHLVDEETATDWYLEDANLRLVQDEDLIEISGSGGATGDGAPQSLDFNLEFVPQRREFRAVLALQEANIPDLPVFTSFAENFSGRLVADLSIAFEVRQDGIDVVSVDVSTQPGELQFGDDAYPIGSNSLLVEYDIEQDDMFIDARNVDLDFAQGDIRLELDAVTNILEDPFLEPHAVSMQSGQMRLDFTPYFPESWTIGDVRAETLVDLRRRQIDVLDMTASADGAQVFAQGRLYLAEPDRLPDDLPFGLSMTAAVDGAVGPETVLKFWPVSLGEDARIWVEEHVLAGEFTGAQFRMDLSPDELRDERLDNEDLQLDFDFTNTTTSFLDDLPPVRRARGTARLLGNSFSLDLDSGEFSNWTLTAGSVSIPQFKPKGENFFVDADGFGEIQDILRTLSNSSLQLEAQYGLNISDITGSGQAHFSLVRPALSEVPYEDTLFTVEGRITDGGFNELYNDMSLTNGQADINVSNELLRISGYGQFADAPIEFTWSDRFREEGVADRSRIRASGFVSPDFINRFGVAIRTYMTGSAFAEFDAFGPSVAELETIGISLDFTESRLDVEEFSWFKAIGEPANADVTIQSLGDEQTTTVAFVAGGVDFQGDVSLGADGRLSAVNVDRIYIEDELDLRGELRRPDPLSLELELAGPYLNAAPLLEGVLDAGGAGNGALPIIGNVSLDARIDQLRLRNDLEAQSATMRVEFAGPRLKVFDLSGLLEGDNPFSLNIQGLDDGHNQLNAEASNAGGLISAVLGLDFVTGGNLGMSGVMRSDAQPSELSITLNNIRMANAPLLTQVLSLASLRGLSDVMSGEGVLFSNVEIPLTLTPDGFYIRGGKASGPALGLTANGHMLDDGEDLQISGVLVPSFGVNSALGGIPIIGDLFVSREGEGVFAITYDVRGSLEEARVSVNPLSGIVPGVLRRIFENPEAPVPQAEEVAEPAE